MILGDFKDLPKGSCMEDISLGLMSYIYVIVWFFCAQLSHCQPSQVGFDFQEDTSDSAAWRADWLINGLSLKKGFKLLTI